LLQQRNDFFNRGDLLISDKHSSVFKLNNGLLRVGDKLRRDVSSVNLCKWVKRVTTSASRKTDVLMQPQKWNKQERSPS
jgi:hypothetical protein